MSDNRVITVFERAIVESGRKSNLKPDRGNRKGGRRDYTWHT